MPHAEAPGARIYYEVHGAGDPLVVIPGFGSTTTIFRKSAPAFAERFRTILLDPRGSGRSDAPAGEYSMEQLADDVIAVLDASGEGRAHVIGTSLGGMIAQHVALRHPDRLRRLVLACTTHGGPRHVMPTAETIVTFMAAGDIADPVEAVRSTFPMHYSAAYLAAHAGELEEYALATASLRSTPQGRAGQGAAAAHHDTYDRLPRIAAPTLVLHGDADPLVRVENGRTLAERIPGARLIVYPRAKHIFFVECAERMNADIVAFLADSSAEEAA